MNDIVKIFGFLLLIDPVVIAQQQVDTGLNRRQRRAEFMRSGGEKARLVEAGFIRGVSGLAKALGGLAMSAKLVLQTARCESRYRLK